jgi:hypothetical protein
MTPPVATDAAPADGARPAPAPPPVPQSVPLPCPLCDYDLRGLTEPRCPECGYRFDWSDLTDPAKRLHPYLFEHHSRHNGWSFMRTMLGGLRPRRFWSSLKPSQPSRVPRLLLYWLLATLLVPLAYAAAFTDTAVSYAKDHEVNRKMQLTSVTRYFATYGAVPGMGKDIAAAGGPQQWVDQQFPPVGTVGYLRLVFEQFYRPQSDQALECAVILLAWPWVTLATLMIFRVSMRRAKVNSVHVLRCTLYCCDATVWLGIVALFVVPQVIQWLDLGRHTAYRDAIVAAPLFALFVGWRLSAAYKHYLQFHRPAATAFAAQAIVLMLVWACVLQRSMGGR